MKPQHEVADILALYGQEFLENNNIPSYKRKVLNDIEKCRTAYFGGHIINVPTADTGRRVIIVAETVTAQSVRGRNVRNGYRIVKPIYFL